MKIGPENDKIDIDPRDIAYVKTETHTSGYYGLMIGWKGGAYLVVTYPKYDDREEDYKKVEQYIKTPPP